MSLRFVRSSEAIERLKELRGLLSLSASDFSIWGAAEYESARKTTNFMGNREAIICVMLSSSSSNTLHEQAGGESLVLHGLDVVLFLRTKDVRGQASDEKAVWYKEFVVRALQGWEPWANAPLVYFGGDSDLPFKLSDYARVFNFTQSVYVQREDVLGDGEYGDLDDFECAFLTMNAITPSFDDITPDIETTVDVQ